MYGFGSDAKNEFHITKGLYIKSPKKHLAVNSFTTASLSKNTKLCQTMENENKCYRSFGEANLVCLDEANSNSTAIELYCGDDSIPDKEFSYTSELCPENAISKTAYHQCYNTNSLKREK